MSKKTFVLLVFCVFVLFIFLEEDFFLIYDDFLIENNFFLYCIEIMKNGLRFFIYSITISFFLFFFLRIFYCLFIFKSKKICFFSFWFQFFPLSFLYRFFTTKGKMECSSLLDDLYKFNNKKRLKHLKKMVEKIWPNISNEYEKIVKKNPVNIFYITFLFKIFQATYRRIRKSSYKDIVRVKSDLEELRQGVFKLISMYEKGVQDQQKIENLRNRHFFGH